MSGRDKVRPQRRDRISSTSGEGKKCSECRKYSRKTFYCAKNQKVLDQNKEVCDSFAPRHLNRENRTRKLFRKLPAPPWR